MEKRKKQCLDIRKELHTHHTHTCTHTHTHTDTDTHTALQRH